MLEQQHGHKRVLVTCQPGLDAAAVTRRPMDAESALPGRRLLHALGYQCASLEHRGVPAIADPCTLGMIGERQASEYLAEHLVWKCCDCRMAAVCVRPAGVSG